MYVMKQRKDPRDYAHEVDPDPPKVCKRVFEPPSKCKKNLEPLPDPIDVCEDDGKKK